MRQSFQSDIALEVLAAAVVAAAHDVPSVDCYGWLALVGAKLFPSGMAASRDAVPYRFCVEPATLRSASTYWRGCRLDASFPPCVVAVLQPLRAGCLVVEALHAPSHGAGAPVLVLEML